jgi:(S)-ureidoglycine aminohydrolase
MKFLFLSLMLFVSAVSMSQADSLASAVYAWKQLKVEKTETGEKRQILEGSTTHLDYFEIHATTLQPGKAPHAPHKHEEEEMIIIKEGKLKITIKDSSKVLGPGSVAVIMPGELHGFVNAGTTDATYYVIKSKATVDKARAAKAGGSLMIDATEVAYKEGPKGGKKQYFERATGVMQRLEMHMTILNEGLKSHDPHTHFAEEMMIVISGVVDIQIGEEHHTASAGDLVFINSGILHAPANAGKGPCSYFAIQFQ